MMEHRRRERYWRGGTGSGAKAEVSMVGRASLDRVWWEIVRLGVMPDSSTHASTRSFMFPLSFRTRASCPMVEMMVNGYARVIREYMNLCEALSVIEEGPSSCN